MLVKDRGECHDEDGLQSLPAETHQDLQHICMFGLHDNTINIKYIFYIFVDNLQMQAMHFLDLFCSVYFIAV